MALANLPLTSLCHWHARDFPQNKLELPLRCQLCQLSNQNLASSDYYAECASYNDYTHYADYATLCRSLCNQQLSAKEKVGRMRVQLWITSDCTRHSHESWCKLYILCRIWCVSSADFVIMQIMHFMQFLVRSIMQIMHMLQSITLANCITFKLHKYVESTRAADSSKLECGSEHCKLFLSLCEGCSCYLAEI